MPRICLFRPVLIPDDDVAILFSVRVQSPRVPNRRDAYGPHLDQSSLPEGMSQIVSFVTARATRGYTTPHVQEASHENDELGVVARCFIRGSWRADRASRIVRRQREPVGGNADELQSLPVQTEHGPIDG